MSEQQYGLAAASAGEIYLQMVAKVLYPVKLCVSAEGFKPSGEVRAQLIYGLLVVGWRLDLYQLANGLNDRVVALLKITQGPDEFVVGNRFNLFCFRGFLRHAILFWKRMTARRTV
jgi:hypothetical protein